MDNRCGTGRMPHMSLAVLGHFFLVALTVAATTPSTNQEQTVVTARQTLSNEIEQWLNSVTKPHSYRTSYGPTREANYDRPKTTADPWQPWQPWLKPSTDKYPEMDPVDAPSSEPAVIPVGGLTFPTIPPFNYPVINNNNNNAADDGDVDGVGTWDQGDDFNSYSLITLAVVLLVFFKVTVIGVMIARRMKVTQRQRRLLVRSTNSRRIVIPNEITSDQAHLVTPANIIYVDTTEEGPPLLISQLYGPPAYTEVAVQREDTAAPVVVDDLPPPYVG